MCEPNAAVVCLTISAGEAGSDRSARIEIADASLAREAMDFVRVVAFSAEDDEVYVITTC